MKQNRRKIALAKRNQIPAEKRAEKSAKIAEHILQSEAYWQAARVFSYVSMGTEVETRELLRQALRDGKIVAVPKTEKNRKMFFLEICSLAELQEGRFGVWEPIGEKDAALVPAAGDLFLVPGVLFDRKKNRMGYGGGYYDTYFETYKGYRKIGLAFSEQISEEIPIEETDVPLDDIVTENGWEESR